MLYAADGSCNRLRKLVMVTFPASTKPLYTEQCMTRLERLANTRGSCCGMERVVMCRGMPLLGVAEVAIMTGR